MAAERSDAVRSSRRASSLAAEVMNTRGEVRRWSFPERRDVGAAAPDRSNCPFDITSVRSSRSRRSEEHTSELQSLMRISYAVFCLKKKKTYTQQQDYNETQQTHLQYED